MSGLKPKQTKYPTIWANKFQNFYVSGGKTSQDWHVGKVKQKIKNVVGVYLVYYNFVNFCSRQISQCVSKPLYSILNGVYKEEAQTKMNIF